MRVSLQPSYILHSRPYRDSSALLEVLTAEYGRISLVARGARRRSRGVSSAALLQPFIPLLLSFSGRTELKTLTATEAVGKVSMLRGERMFSGLYVNELVVRLLHQHDAHPQLFAAYARTLQALAGNEVVDTVLRRFEFSLLHELGYSFDLSVDGASGAPVRENLWYHYHPDFGMVARGDAVDQSHPAFGGSDLLLMASGEFGGQVRLTAKRLLRQALATHLGNTPLRSRDLFRTGSAVREPSKGPVELNTGDKL
ncbi:MAG: DNA repair protein RecO [Gammaproteobacteria bacterium]|nr:MAG: DNA repair protein RecO [Gammaproteobacteria bacterium]RLA57586.1 MAG: DNA repair protein RecO [Gammaproteobacteria bacterium]HDY82829.1 DNA repair protein RecO [Halieaceae bacterium]